MKIVVNFVFSFFSEEVVKYSGVLGLKVESFILYLLKDLAAMICFLCSIISPAA